MKKVKSIVLILSLSFLTFGLTSCGEEPIEEPVPIDIINQVLGSYSGNYTMIESGNDVGITYDINFTISKVKDNPSAIEIKIGKSIIKCTNLLEVKEGVSFCIEKQKVDLNDDNIDEEIVGFNLELLSPIGAKYHALYDSNKQEFSFGIKNNSEDYFIFGGKKN